MGRKVEHGPLPLINMAVGIPDGETPKGIVDHFADAVRILKIKNMVHFMVSESFKEAIVNFYQRQYGVELHKDDEVCILYGTKNGLVALPTCIVNPEKTCYFQTQVIRIILLVSCLLMPIQYHLIWPPHYLPD